MQQLLSALNQQLVLGEKVVKTVEIYTWHTCPFCKRAKRLLDAKGLKYIEYSVDGDEAARDAMVARGNGVRTVPQIFIDDRHIGGSDHLYALDKAGELDNLLGLQT